MSTFVLVHGAWHGGWCWRWVREHLENHGHLVYTPTMTGVGEKAHMISSDITLDTVINDVIETITDEGLTNVILVGHSFAGPVISGVAERLASRINQLIYLDAAILENGESMFSCIPQRIVTERQRLADKTSGGISIPIPTAEKLGISDQERWNYVQRFLTPHPISTYKSPLILEGQPGEGFQCTYIACSKPLYEPLTWARKRAMEYGWKIVELETGHDAMINSPEAVSYILMKASG